MRQLDLSAWHRVRPVLPLGLDLSSFGFSAGGYCCWWWCRWYCLLLLFFSSFFVLLSFLSPFLPSFTHWDVCIHNVFSCFLTLTPLPPPQPVFIFTSFPSLLNYIARSNEEVFDWSIDQSDELIESAIGYYRFVHSSDDLRRPITIMLPVFMYYVMYYVVTFVQTNSRVAKNRHRQKYYFLTGPALILSITTAWRRVRYKSKIMDAQAQADTFNKVVNGW